MRYLPINSGPPDFPPMKTLKYGLLAAAAGALALFGYNRVATRREEGSGPLPGDDIVSNPHIQATHEITIAVAPERVWPWLVQVGYDRAGWYIDAPWWRAMIAPVLISFMSEDEKAQIEDESFDSADRILMEYQHPGLGDVIADGPPGTASFTVVRLERNQLFGLHSNSELRMMIPHRLRGRLGFDGEFGWAFVLEETSDGGTKLTSRVRIRLEPSWLRHTAPLFRLADHQVQRAILAGVKRRAESWEHSVTRETPEEEEADGWRVV
jgi:hypothetical protein